MRFDSGFLDKQRIVIYFSDENLVDLKESPTWIGDGTFYSAPKPFKQIYTLGALIFGKFVPMIYGLLSDKSEFSYNFFFDFISKRIPTVDKKEIILDFEWAPIKVFKNIYLGSTVQGCYFHFCQSIYRNVQKSSCVESYLKDTEFRRIVKMLFALAYVPEEFVLLEYIKLKTFIEKFPVYNTLLKDVLTYFEGTYIGEIDFKIKKITRAAQFTIQMWNIHQAVLDDELKTINSIEGWHRSLNTNFIVAHPSLVSFLTFLKNEEFVVRTKIKEILLNPKIEEGNEIKKTIKTICKCYKKYYKLDYLNALALVGKWKMK